MRLALAVNLINIPNQTTAPLVNEARYATDNKVERGEVTCIGNNGTTRYTCVLPWHALEQYYNGMQILFIPDTPCVSACSLAIDQQNGVSLKQGDGVTDASFLAGHGYWLYFFGGVFRTTG